MQITRTRSKYYVLSFLGALIVAMGVLAVAPSAKAQNGIDPTIDKECSPNPVQVGQQITCTIDVVAAPNTEAHVLVSDTFPAGATVTEATWTFVQNGTPLDERPCEVDANNVTCPSPPISAAIIGGDVFFRATITATAVQCGAFTNTATASGIISSNPGRPRFTVEDTEEIVVKGCEEPLPTALGQQQEGAAPAPITQEGEQESESGEIDQSFEVS